MLEMPVYFQSHSSCNRGNGFSKLVLSLGCYFLNGGGNYSGNGRLGKMKCKTKMNNINLIIMLQSVQGQFGPGIIGLQKGDSQWRIQDFP